MPGMKSRPLIVAIAVLAAVLLALRFTTC